uniref:F-box domain-containing protein n=1 Tax=Acrobeloides nanus TaxID=290746 RepID=A0A914C854_9BILA
MEQLKGEGTALKVVRKRRSSEDINNLERNEVKKNDPKLMEKEEKDKMKKKKLNSSQTVQFCDYVWNIRTKKIPHIPVKIFYDVLQFLNPIEVGKSQLVSYSWHSAILQGFYILPLPKLQEFAYVNEKRMWNYKLFPYKRYPNLKETRIDILSGSIDVQFLQEIESINQRIGRKKLKVEIACFIFKDDTNCEKNVVYLQKIWILHKILTQIDAKCLHLKFETYTQVQPKSIFTFLLKNSSLLNFLNIYDSILLEPENMGCTLHWDLLEDFIFNCGSESRKSIQLLLHNVNVDEYFNFYMIRHFLKKEAMIKAIGSVKTSSMWCEEYDSEMTELLKQQSFRRPNNHTEGVIYRFTRKDDSFMTFYSRSNPREVDNNRKLEHYFKIGTEN